jgi:hypothetical protein
MLINRLELSLFLSLFFPPFFYKKIGTYYKSYAHFSWKCPSSSARLHTLALPAWYMGAGLPIYQVLLDKNEKWRNREPNPEEQRTGMHLYD